MTQQMHIPVQNQPHSWDEKHYPTEVSAAHKMSADTEAVPQVLLQAHFRIKVKARALLRVRFRIKVKATVLLQVRFRIKVKVTVLPQVHFRIRVKVTVLRAQVLQRVLLQVRFRNTLLRVPVKAHM